MMTTSSGTINRNPAAFIDPLGNDQLNLTPPQITASLLARVWKAQSYALKGGIFGMAVGACTGLILGALGRTTSSSTEKPPSRVEDPLASQLSLAGLGAAVGGLVGAGVGICYSWYRDNYVHFQLKTDHVGEDGNTTRKVALDKASYIFKAYANRTFGDAAGLCDDILTCHLYIYPVKAGDGNIYEHSSIFHYLTVNYPLAAEAYEERRQAFPDDPTVLPPRTSPVAGGEVTLKNLRLDIKTMGKISQKMAEFFEELRQWESRIQPPIEEAYKKEESAVFTTPQTALSEEAVRAVDEKALADKVSTEQQLSLEEIFIIKQLFDYYLVELKERDHRIHREICLALATQQTRNIISEDRFVEEMAALGEWYTSAKELYK